MSTERLRTALSAVLLAVLLSGCALQPAALFPVQTAVRPAATERPEESSSPAEEQSSTGGEGEKADGTEEAAASEEDADEIPVWEQAIADVKLSSLRERRAFNVIRIAASQLGYEEEQGGYTIFGDWYGFPRLDWCAMFASFCLNYGGVDDVPLCSECNEWVRQLQERNMFHKAGDGFVPAKGDLIFFDYSHSGRSGHVGLVEDVVDGWVLTIEGNSSDAVRECQYLLTAGNIYGYGELKLSRHSMDDEFAR